MEYLQYQLRVSAYTLAIIRLTFKVSRDYTICTVCSGKGEWNLVLQLWVAWKSVLWIELLTS